MNLAFKSSDPAFETRKHIKLADRDKSSTSLASSLIAANYSVALTRTVSIEKAREAARAARRVWPDGVSRCMSIASYRALAHQLGIVLQMHPYDGPAGLSLRGFYFQAGSQSSRPVIFLNAAHHPAAIAGAWLHELGHHLTQPLVPDDMPRQMHSDLTTHLTDPAELLADIVATVAAYPRSVADSMFRSRAIQRRTASSGGPDSRIQAKVRSYLRRLAHPGKPSSPAPTRIRQGYIGETIHFAKLRCALLSQYEI